jgi:DNA repair exonuclease SbcCD ATPase subunit
VTVNLPEHVSLGELQQELSKFNSAKKRLKYLRLQLDNVVRLKDDKLYVSERDRQDEDFDLKVIQGRIRDLEAETERVEENFPVEAAAKVKALESELAETEEELKQQQDVLGEDEKEYGFLWRLNKNLASTIKRLRQQSIKLRQENLAFKTQTTILEGVLNRSVYLKPLPAKYGRLNRKQQTKILRERQQEYQRQKQEINRILNERVALQKNLKLPLRVLLLFGFNFAPIDYFCCFPFSVRLVNDNVEVDLSTFQSAFNFTFYC